MSEARSNDYIARQDAKNAAAAQLYTDLLPSLTPEQRAILQEEVKTRKGVEVRGNMADSLKVMSNRGECDAAEIPVPAEGYEVTAGIDTVADELSEAFGLTHKQAAKVSIWHAVQMKTYGDREGAIRLARLAGFLFRSENLKQSLYALMYATHTASANGLGSMRVACKEILKPNGQPVTVASLSKEANKLVSFLDLPPGEGMKSNASVRTYSDVQKVVHKQRQSARVEKAVARF